MAEILSASRHPNADKLQVCQVNTGTETLQIVCGAPNARAGIKVVLAQPGTYIPGLDITIKKGEIRGEESNGMLCSASELGISDDHDGIMELPADAEAGMAAAAAAGMDDPVIEIAITPNRGDCLGVRGVARDLAAAGFGTLKPLDLSPEAGGFASPLGWGDRYKRRQRLSACDRPLFQGCHKWSLSRLDGATPHSHWSATYLFIGRYYQLCDV